MTCVSKEYEIKTKMEQEEGLLLKMLFSLGYNLKLVTQWWGGRGIKIWWVGVFFGEIFLGGDGVRKFLAGEEDSPPFSQWEKHCIYIYIYIVCNHEITQTLQFAETSFQHPCNNRNLENFIELLTVTSAL